MVRVGQKERARKSEKEQEREKVRESKRDAEVVISPGFFLISSKIVIEAHQFWTRTPLIMDRRVLKPICSPGSLSQL